MTLAPRTSVRAVTRPERRHALATLTAAFAADPVNRWAWPDDRDYEARFPAFAEALGGRAFAYGTAERTAGFEGTALWLPPSVTPDEEALSAILDSGVPAERRPEMLELLEQLGAAHPAGPHWYLPMIGVVPAHQGRGLGGLLLSHALARCDAEHLPAYLESTNPANVPLYERHGFRVVGTIHGRTSPPLFPMVRPAR